MARDPRYDILFEPVKIGPVTAPNRFYQVPHCNGMGWLHPSAMVAMRRVKAEGGWGVVATEECDVHPSSEAPQNRVLRLWDDADMPVLQRMADVVHAHGSLAAIELSHCGHTAANYTSREVPLAPSGRPCLGYDPLQARAMDKQDIANLRRWQRNAAARARAMEFDIVYVYAGQDLGLPLHFLSRRHNRRTDEYGGSLENRARLMRELIDETRDAAGDRCAVAVRLSIDALAGPEGATGEDEARELIEILGELPDLWDVTRVAYPDDMTPSRIHGENSQEEHVAFFKQVTTKPVVGVGRYTSPDTMVSLVKRGVLDFIGAARPSIADPFLPKKIEEGRPEDIRECIGCNMCLASDEHAAIMRCTQNPTAGEEWRKGWHPEVIPPRESDERILIVGGGPAGLEAARGLGQRGHDVMLAEASTDLGGRVARERRLPGLAEWGRVQDYRVSRIERMANVEVYRDSMLSAADVLETGCARVAIATGSVWRRDGLGRSQDDPIEGARQDHVVTPDDVMAGATPPGPVLIYDDDHYYMGGVLAERLVLGGTEVVLVTPAPVVSAWTEATAEQEHIQARLIELGVGIVPLHTLSAIGEGGVVLACVYSGQVREQACQSVVLVTSREPVDGLYHDLMADPDRLASSGIARIARIGDCYGPGTIAAAVYGGHRFARELGDTPADGVLFRRDLAALADDAVA